MIVNALSRGVTLTLAALVACAPARVRRTLVPSSQISTLDKKSPYLKAHLRSGYVYILDSWEVDSAGATVTGKGSLLTPNRSVERQGDFEIPADSVALFETNVLQRGGAVAGLSVLTGITAAVTVACIASPKTCFGSCPTFYVRDSAGALLQAEGFSASIAPALEATDVDALYRAVVTGRDFRVKLKNEALETHVIRYADILAVRRPSGGRVLISPDGRFLPATDLRRPTRCADAKGDCLDAVSAFDGRERTSLADSLDLSTRETIDLEFVRGSSRDVGLVIASKAVVDEHVPPVSDARIPWQRCRQARRPGSRRRSASSCRCASGTLLTEAASTRPASRPISAASTYCRTIIGRVGIPVVRAAKGLSPIA